METAESAHIRPIGCSRGAPNVSLDETLYTAAVFVASQAVGVQQTWSREKTAGHWFWTNWWPFSWRGWAGNEDHVLEGEWKSWSSLRLSPHSMLTLTKHWTSKPGHWVLQRSDKDHDPGWGSLWLQVILKIPGVRLVVNGLADSQNNLQVCFLSLFFCLSLCGKSLISVMSPL